MLVLIGEFLLGGCVLHWSELSSMTLRLSFRHMNAVDVGSFITSYSLHIGGFISPSRIHLEFNLINRFISLINLVFICDVIHL